MRRHLLTAAAVLAASSLVPAIGGKAQDDLRARWLGAWVVLASGVASDCSGMHTNNAIHGQLSLGGGVHRFEPGELGQVTGLDLKQARVDVFVSLREDLLVPYQDGPFELYRQAPCRVELLVDLPRPMVKANDVAGIDRAILQVAERHTTLDQATASARWNRREREAYPPDYERRLGEHAVWKAEQRNAAVDRKIEASIAAAQEVLARVSHEREGYSEAFALGVEAMRALRFDDCDRMLASTFDGWKRKPPEGTHLEGHADGQFLTYSIRLADRLKGCYVPVPALPAEGAVAEALPQGD
jgi:hypothetical protein